MLQVPPPPEPGLVTVTGGNSNVQPALGWKPAGPSDPACLSGLDRRGRCCFLQKTLKRHLWRCRGFI